MDVKGDLKLRLSLKIRQLAPAAVRSVMAPSSPPRKSHAGEYEYRKINNLAVGPSFNFYGVAVQVKAPRPTRGEDYMMSMVLTDDTVPTPVDASCTEPDGIVVNIFRPGLGSFPRVESTMGRDIVQLRHVRIQRYQNKLQAVSAKWSAWTVFRRDEEGKWASYPPREIAASEIEELDSLEKAMEAKDPNGTSEDVPPLNFEEGERPSYKRRPRCLQTIAQLEPNTFFDFIGEVESSGDSPMGGTSFYFRDYSTDQNLSIIFWDNFATEAEEKFCIGGLVYLSNVHAREASDRIAGSMHGDPSAARGTRIKLLNRNSPLVQELLRRKEREEEHEIADKQQEDFSMRHVVPPPAKEPAPIASAKKGPWTKIDWAGVPVTAVASVLECSKKNFKFCIKVRVQGTKPESPLDWSRSLCKACNRTWKGDTGESCQYCGKPWNRTFTWAFTLVCSDATGSIDLVICYDDATYFLAGLQPVDINSNPDAKEKLEAVLKTFLGSQSETKFCISSYEVAGSRRYRVSDTQITF